MSLYKLITPKEFSKLIKNTTNSRVIPVDATWYLPIFKKDGRSEFRNVERIPNAVYFHLGEVSDNEPKASRMLPTLDVFNGAMSKLGIKSDDTLVVYDRINNFSASRVAWVLTTLGHSKVYLMTGFNQYVKEGYTVDHDKVLSDSPYPATKYESTNSFKGEQVISFEALSELVSSGKIKDYNLFDARSEDRFLGEEDAGATNPPTSGHVLGSQPLPYMEVLDDGTFPSDPKKMLEKVEQSLKEHGTHFDRNRPTIVMCNSGVTACIIKTAIELASLGSAKLYDGSFSEWALRADPKYIARGKDW
ncbi:thiosulfate sulfurtransferase Ecym_2381 [Eremothecium cymbalariae DBVPG|uniref:Sulfurtransferase n=1 Tax=Eremothecium cymbalariae (strain CBS 270.75 / DBVPG 7215 / KCTC 17166 / NRRL Y-17582) TaxID=931890 RepID=G8JNP6_ERECY|nr:Hypothetical protein Ecym_2381 [Eremothecium cymbalariae DBVPG\